MGCDSLSFALALPVLVVFYLRQEVRQTPTEAPPSSNTEEFLFSESLERDIGAFAGFQMERLSDECLGCRVVICLPGAS